MLTGFFNILLDVFVEIDAEKHAEKTEKVDFEFEAQRKFEENQIDGERADARVKVSSEDRLNIAMRGHDPEDLS
jgi:hypothetical protein